MSRSFIPEIMVVDSILNHLLQYEHAVFYASNNKSNGVAKTIYNMFSVVKDRIHNQTYDVKHINKFYVFYGSVIKDLPPSFKILYVAGMGCWEVF